MWLVLLVSLSLYDRPPDSVLTDFHLEAGALSLRKVTVQIWREQVQCPKADCQFERQSSRLHRADCLQPHLKAINKVAARSWLISRGTNEPALPEVSCTLWFLTASLASDLGPQVSLMLAAPLLPGHRRLMTEEKVLLSNAFTLLWFLKMLLT